MGSLRRSPEPREEGAVEGRGHSAEGTERRGRLASPWGPAAASTLPDSPSTPQPPGRHTDKHTHTHSPPSVLSNCQECRLSPSSSPLHSSAATPTWQGKLYPGLAIKATFQKKKLRGPRETQLTLSHRPCLTQGPGVPLSREYKFPPWSLPPALPDVRRKACVSE